MYKIIGSDQKEYGPIAREKIRQWLTEGRLNRQTPVQVDGASDWKPLETIPEFSDAFVASAAPPVLMPAAPQASSDGINVIIPYKNVRALVAYYLAVFSLIPFVGIFLGLAAFVLGILGLRFRHRNPRAGGAVHSWIGVIVGGLFGFGYLAATLFLVFATLGKHH